jgi:hypothetical protein
MRFFTPNPQVRRRRVVYRRSCAQHHDRPYQPRPIETGPAWATLGGTLTLMTALFAAGLANAAVIYPVAGYCLAIGGPIATAALFTCAVRLPLEKPYIQQPRPPAK